MDANAISTWNPPKDSREPSKRVNVLKPVEEPHHNNPHADEHGTRAQTHRPAVGWVVAGLILIAGMSAGLFFIGWKPNAARKATLIDDAERVKNAPMRVAVTKPKRSDVVLNLQLPSEVHAERETSIYARISGYLKSWSVDIGDHVKSGQEIAVIDAPELDMQLAQARSALKQAEATLTQSQAALARAKTQRNEVASQVDVSKARSELAEVVKNRYIGLRESNSVNDELIAEKVSEDKVAKASVVVAQAAVLSADAAIEDAQAMIVVNKAKIGEADSAVKRLEVMQNFEKVVAPFDGIITLRQLEVGGLVSAGSSGAGQALFNIVATNTVRVYVDVPQSAAPSIKDGQTVQLTLREFPGVEFTGAVARTNKSIDPASRTLRTEVRIANPDGKLLSGMYARVNLNVANPAPPLLLPGSALIVNSSGTRVALVQNGRIHFQPVNVEADYGANVGIGTGLGENDIVVANPSERLAEDLPVTVSQPQEK